MEWGVDFPWDELTDDPFERWLLEEAVLVRYEDEARSQAKRAEARDEAKAKAREALKR